MPPLASLSRATGLSIIAWAPTIVRGTSYTPAGQLVDAYIADKATSYSHTIKAAGGWWAASLSFTGNRLDIEEWYENGLGRHIEVRNPAGILVWAGFVDSVSIEVGTLSATAGPLMETANRVSVIYTPILDATTMVTGTQTTTTIADDTDSQDRYGILEGVVSGGELLDDGVTDDAAKYRDTYIAEHRWPSTSERLSTGASQQARATLNLKGYVHFLQRYIANEPTMATCSVYVKLTDALGDDPNGLLSVDYSHMTATPWLVSRNEEKNRNAWVVVNEMVNLGNAANERFTFGVYEGQRFHYQAAPDTIKYQHRLGQTAVRIEDYGQGTPVEPWDVQAGEWVFLSDFLAGLIGTRATPFRTDHRYVFAEEVIYRAPYEVEVVGDRYATLAQWLAKRGLSA